MNLLADLRRLGVQEGDTLLVHSSYKSLGKGAPSPLAVISALRRAVGESGTLLMPALSHDFVHAGQRMFDIQRTPSCIGALPELFRQTEGVRRSLAPTHSCCAVGRLARELTGSHHLDDTPVGPHSPYNLLQEAGGKILFLGCSPEKNTSMHGVEERVRPPYLFLPEPITYDCRDGAGVSHSLTVYRHNFQWQGRPVSQHYARMLSLLTEEERSEGQVGEARCVLLSAPAVWEKGEAALRQDPWYFVEVE